MTRQQRKWLSFLIGILVSAVAIWMLFRGVDFAELVAVLEQANYWWVLPNMAFIVLGMYQRAYRWKFMLLPVKRVAFSNLQAATCIGFMANNVLPLRLGEFVRAYSLAYQDREVSKSASLATIFIERMVFDLVVLLLIFGVIVGVASIEIPREIKIGTYIAISIALAGIAMVALLARKPDQAANLITRYLPFIPERIKATIKAIILRFSTGLTFVTQARVATSVMIQTIIIWICMGVSNYFVFVAFGFDTLTLETSFFLLVVVSISILIPSSPGFVGVYHAGTVLTLTQYGIGREEATAFALVLHAAQYIPVTLMGFYYLRKEHLTLKQLEDESPD